MCFSERGDTILKTIFCTLFTFLLLALPISAHAQNSQTRYTQLELLTEKTELSAGETATIALEQMIAPHWHTYWKNPGDSGAAPIINWTLPDGWSVSDIIWQTPDKIPYGPLLNYGYSNSALLMQNLTAPEDYQGEPVTLTADIEVLVCEDICIPEYDTLSVTLNAGNAPSSYDQDIIQSSKKDLPPPLGTKATYKEDSNHFTLSASLPATLRNKTITHAEFIPEAWGAVINAAPPSFEIKNNILSITQERGEQDTEEFQTLNGILKITDNAAETYIYEFTAQPENTPQNQATQNPSNTDKPNHAPLSLVGIITTIFLAFIGGLILNLMPCVFPVLSIKALSLVKLADHHPEQAKAHGIAYTSGIILSFLLIAGIMIAIQASGAEIGWGFQLQNPLVIGILTYLLFVIGLNLSGLFEIKNPFANIGSKAASKNSPSGAFFTGILATLVATPCTAPFMATALGVALVQPPIIALLIFTGLGFGLAFPFLLLSFLPNLQKIMPKPGAWMKTFQTALAFPMFLATAWMLWVLAQQVDPVALIGVFCGLVFLALAMWLLKFKNTATKILSICALIAAIIGLLISVPLTPNTHMDLSKKFTPETLAEALKTDKPVFTEMTAAWCITCKINHAAAINIESTHKLFNEKNVEFLIGDWTNKDPAITAYLHSFDRAGVPLYVYYPAPRGPGNMRPDPIILPQILTPQIVENAILEKE